MTRPLPSSTPTRNTGAYKVTVTFTDKDGGVGVGTFMVSVIAAPTVQGVVINDGSAQRRWSPASRSTFSAPSPSTPAAFEVRTKDGGPVGLIVTTSQVDGRTVAVLIFSGRTSSAARCPTAATP